MEFTFRDYVRILFRQKVVVLISILTVTITVFINLVFKTPVYEAQVKMLISAEKQVQSPYYREIYGEHNIKVALTQSEVVKSTPVLERTVQALALDQKPADYERPYASPLKIFLTDLFKKRPTPEERAHSSLAPEQAFLNAVASLKNSIKVDPIRDTNLFVIKVRDFDPVQAAMIANVISRSYIIFDLEQQLADLTMKYGEKHPAVQQLRDNVNHMVERLNGNPLSNIDAIGPATVKIIEQAHVPLDPVGPRKMLSLLMALMIGGVMGIVLAFIFEYMDPTFKSSQEIEMELSLPFLGSVPRRNLIEKPLIFDAKRKSIYSYHYQILFDHLYLLIKDKQLKSLMITAASSDEETSRVMTNLGLFLSQKAGRKVLLIDGNFRNPSLHHVWKVDNFIGFANVLEGQTALPDVAQEMKKNLDLVCAGHTEHNPMILLDSGKVKEVLEQAQQHYDIVLVDCPHLKSYKDPLVLSSSVNATVVIVNEGQTRRQVLKRSLQAFKEKQMNILGVVLNNKTFPIPRFVYERV